MLRMLLLIAASLLAHPCFALSKAERFIQAAHEQIGVTVRYDSAYRPLAYPGGDVPLERGVCTDVVVRAYRKIGIDLQVLVHQDMQRAFARYPRLWGIRKPDANIDHRRVPNLATFMTRHGQSLALSRQPQDYQPGDLVTWRLDSGVPHIGIVSDRKTDGRPLLVHNIGRGAQLEDVLFAWTITGHYRYFPQR